MAARPERAYHREVRLVPGLALAAAAVAATAVVEPASARIALERVGRFTEPVYVTAPAGDRERLFVVERRGRIRIVRDGRALRRPFLDLTRSVVIRTPRPEQDHRGMVSLAFAPDYRRSRRLYVSYTDAADMLRIDELRASRRNRDRVDRRSRRTLLSVPLQSSFDFGGHLAFGPDGLLYAGIGFGKRADSQDLGVLGGKLLRIDPRAGAGAGYAIPPGNPFAGTPGARPEIYAYGLRNPWRFSFDRSTGDLAIGDVGQNSVEEVDFMRRGRAAGANFGWDVFEGGERQKPDAAPGHVPPVLERRHSDEMCALIGGHVVRDRRLRGLYGRYLYGDLCTGLIRSARLSESGARGDREERFWVRGGLLVSFGEDARRRVYAVSLAGRVYRLVRR